LELRNGQHWGTSAKTWRVGDIRGSRTWQVHSLLTNKFCPLWLTSNHIVPRKIKFNSTCVFKVSQFVKLWKHAWNYTLILVGPMRLPILILIRDLVTNL
jgi:hypothetical protein